MPTWRWAATTAAAASPSIRMRCLLRSAAGRSSPRARPEGPQAGAWRQSCRPALLRFQDDVSGDMLDTLATAAAVSPALGGAAGRSEEHTSELQSQSNLVCRLLLEKKKTSPQ